MKTPFFSALLFFFISIQALAESPSVQAKWRRNQLTLEVLAPQGEHIAPESPAEGWVSLDGERLDLQTSGVLLAQGLVLGLGKAKTHSVEGVLHLALCKDNGTACRPLSLGFQGDFSKRRGRKVLSVRNPEPEPVEEEAPVSTVEQALAQAKTTGQFVLLDFSAQWCAPCQLLAAEVLHNPEHAQALSPFVLVELDADLPVSFPWKARYGISGYPTLIVVDAEANLVSRLMGYDDHKETLGWLAEVAAQGESLDVLLAKAPELVESARLLLAKRLIAEDRKAEASPLVAGLSDTVGRALLEFEMEPTAVLLTRLIDEAPERIMEWIWTAAYTLMAEENLDPKAKLALRQAVTRSIPTVDAAHAAELSFVLGDLLEDPQEAQRVFALGAAIWRTTFADDPAADRGRYSFLATLLVSAGELEAALDSVDVAIRAFPQEFTFFNKKAGILLEADRHEEALSPAQNAWQYAYGDTRLRAAVRLAEVYVGLGRSEEARPVLEKALKEVVRPAEGEDVRTWKYIESVETALKALDAD
jgi:thioredoxin-like negative regulator of GroEL